MNLPISEYAFLAIAATLAAATLYGIIISNRLMYQMRRRDELSAEIALRQFHSSYSPERSELEREIADLNLRLTQSLEKFNDVNHLVIDGQRRISAVVTPPVSPDQFLDSLGISPNTLRIDENLVFVLTPFHESEDTTYAAIVGAFDSFGVRVVRGDEQAASGDILSHIIKQMLSARIVIANVNTRNPNVMYELGIAHALGKDVIIVASSSSDVPFDINSRSVLFYKGRSDLVEKLRRELVRKVFAKS